MTILLMTSEGSIVAARDRFGRLPVLLGQDADGYCVSFESFAYQKLGYHTCYELGPAEILRRKGIPYFLYFDNKLNYPSNTDTETV